MKRFESDEHVSNLLNLLMIQVFILILAIELGFAWKAFKWAGGVK
jgi:hypothetical protein